MKAEQAKILCFGVLEVDLRAGELRKQGLAVQRDSTA